MSAEWWIRDGNKITGPATVEQLKAMAENSQLSSDTQVRLGRTTRWVEAQSVRWLRKYFDTVDEKESPRPPGIAKPSKTATIALISFVTAICVFALVLIFMLLSINKDVVPMAQHSSDEADIDYSEHLPRRLIPPFQNPRGQQKSESFIEDIRDERAIEQAVGLVVCGWSGVTSTSDAFENRWQPLIYTHKDFDALPTDEQEGIVEYQLPNGKKIYIKVLLGGTGSCFMISRDGYLVTNKHVIEDLHSIERDHRVIHRIKQQHKYEELRPRLWVFLGKKVFVADIRHVSRQFDLAILKIDMDDAPCFRLAASDKLARDAEVRAIGFPGASRDPISREERDFEQESWTKSREIEASFKPSDLAYAMTSGRVSVVVHREGVGWIIQHNADVSGGNSGGPLVDDRAVVVGINTMSITQASGGRASGIFFSLTTNQLRSEIERYVPECTWK